MYFYRCSDCVLTNLQVWVRVSYRVVDAMLRVSYHVENQIILNWVIMVYMYTEYECYDIGIWVHAAEQ